MVPLCRPTDRMNTNHQHRSECEQREKIAQVSQAGYQGNGAHAPIAEQPGRSTKQPKVDKDQMRKG